MKAFYLTISIMMAILFAAGSALAQNYIYPKEGQTEEQMEKDKLHCYSWAKQQSGFDPMEAQAAPPQGEQERTGKRVLKGGLGGAALGAGIGAIAGGGSGAGKGAAAGAVAGGAYSGLKGSKEQQQAEAQQEAQSSQQAQLRQNYDRAFEACMEGKGYTVK